MGGEYGDPAFLPPGKKKHCLWCNNPGKSPDHPQYKSHGFYIAVIQGFFRDYYYTRGSGFSFLVEEKPEYARYFTSVGTGGANSLSKSGRKSDH